MSLAHVSMEVRIIDARISEIAIQGELSALAEDTLMDAYLRACAPRGDSAATTDAASAPAVIILDCHPMTYMNSSGIGLLVTFLIRMRRQKQRLFAYGLSEHYREIFAITRLDEAIGIFDSEAEALAAAIRL